MAAQYPAPMNAAEYGAANVHAKYVSVCSESRKSCTPAMKSSGKTSPYNTNCEYGVRLDESGPAVVAVIEVLLRKVYNRKHHTTEQVVIGSGE
jgi:hypothetical protein